jgi:hypothetical protein
MRRSEPDASAVGRWVAPETLPPPSRIGAERPAMTNHQTAREVVEQARAVVDDALAQRSFVKPSSRSTL